eukprot:684212_1
MDAPVIRCTKCAIMLSFGHGDAGKQIQCPRCKTIMQSAPPQLIACRGCHGQMRVAPTSCFLLALTVKCVRCNAVQTIENTPSLVSMKTSALISNKVEPLNGTASVSSSTSKPKSSGRTKPAPTKRITRSRAKKVTIDLCADGDFDELPSAKRARVEVPNSLTSTSQSGPLANLTLPPQPISSSSASFNPNFQPPFPLGFPQNSMLNGVPPPPPAVLSSMSLPSTMDMVKMEAAIAKSNKVKMEAAIAKSKNVKLEAEIAKSKLWTVKSATKRAPKVKMEKRSKRKRGFTSAIRDRIFRAGSQRMYMIEEEKVGPMERHYAVLGSTGNCYNVIISNLPTCTCPDFAKGNQCKHILFIYLKVLKVAQSSEVVCQRALLESELTGVFANAPQRTGAMASQSVQKKYAVAMGRGGDEGEEEKGQGRKPIEGDCCICFDEVKKSDEKKLVYCKDGCGQNMHRDCMMRWGRSKKQKGHDVTCPYCREAWPVEGPKDSNSGGGVSTNEGYLNFADEQGMDRYRDDSTYNNYNDFSYRSSYRRNRGGRRRRRGWW